VGILLEVLVKFLDKLANERLNARDNGETAHLNGFFAGAFFLSHSSSVAVTIAHFPGAKPRVRRVSCETAGNTFLRTAVADKVRHKIRLRGSENLYCLLSQHQITFR
jgi:hypothetical protein